MSRITRIKKERRNYIWSQLESIVSFLIAASMIIFLVLFILTGEMSEYGYVCMAILLMLSMTSEGIDCQIKSRKLKQRITLLKMLKKLEEESND